MQSTFERLRHALLAASPPAWRSRRLTFVLGTDRAVGRREYSIERRVAVIPEQVAALVELFEELELELSVLVVQGAGVRAGHADCRYVEAGAEIVGQDELPYLDQPPDLVHALKEPTAYEAEIRAPFCRIGALHTGDFHAESGLARLLAGRRVTVLDGSYVGAAARGRVPIRGRMSVFAGQIGATWVCEHLERHRRSGRVVVVGAGHAGSAAARTLLASPAVTGVDLFDLDDPERLEAVRGRFADAGPRIAVGGVAAGEIDDPRLAAGLEGAVGALFAVAKPGTDAPKLVRSELLRDRLATGAVVVDVSIDEKGAIADPGIEDGWHHEQIIPHLERALLPHRYRALANMPRALPRPASEAHGESVLPYLAALLYLAARAGGPDRAAHELAARPYGSGHPDPATAGGAELLETLLQDLRNGLAFRPRRLPSSAAAGGIDRRTVVEDVVASRRAVFGFLHGQRVPFEFSLLPHRVLAPDAARRHALDAIADLPEAARALLGPKIEEGEPVRVLVHPEAGGHDPASSPAAFGLADPDRLVDWCETGAGGIVALAEAAGD